MSAFPRQSSRYSTFPATRPGELAKMQVGNALNRQNQLAIRMHLCGRLETITAENSQLTLPGMHHIARQSFDLPRGQVVGLLDKLGKPIADQKTLQDVVTRGETLYLQLRDTAIHDFERQIEEMQHMQAGFLTERLGSLREDQSAIWQELRAMQAALQSEKLARYAEDTAVRRELDDNRATESRQHVSIGDRVDKMEQTVQEMQQALSEERLDKLIHETKRDVQDIRTTLHSESKARESDHGQLSRSFEELRRAVQLEIVSREGNESRSEKGLQEIDSALATLSERITRDVDDLKSRFLDVEQSCALEQRERCSADDDLATAVRELRLAIQTEGRERVSEHARLEKECGSSEKLVDAEKSARKQAVSDLIKQLSIVVESIEEEQELRATEDAELAQGLAALQRALQEVGQRVDGAERSANRTAGDLAQRVDEIMRTQAAEAADLVRAMQDASGQRQQLTQALGRITGFEKQLQVEAEAREAASEERQSLRRTASHLLENVESEKRGRLEAIQELKATLHSELMAKHDVQARAHKELDAETSNRMAKLADESSRRHEQLERQVDQLSASALQPAPLPRRDETTHKAAAEQYAKLLQECKESIRHEINSCLESDARLREEMAEEAARRNEAVDAISIALEDLRMSLQNHTHDLEGVEVEGVEVDELGQVAEEEEAEEEELLRSFTK